jgi:hypothetical protein
VRFNKGGSPLTALQVVLELDSAAVLRVSAAAAGDWSFTFGAALNDLTAEVQIIGVDGGATGAMVVTFWCAGNGTTVLAGTMVQTLTTDNVLLGDKDRTIEGGAGVLATSPSGGLRG